MNDTIIQVRSLDRDRQHDVASTHRHITVADRLSVRIGLWLLLRDARRNDRERVVDSVARAAAGRRARQEHELNVVRAMHSAHRLL